MKAAPAPIDHHRLLCCIAEVEGGKWGASGGPSQISYSAWSQHSRFSFQLSANRLHARVVYLTHTAWLAACIARLGQPITVDRLAASWRFGFEGARAIGFHCDYATRVDNLYADATFRPAPL